MSEQVRTYGYVMKYEKHGTAAWISHLDSVRLFSRLFHRAGIDVVYSSGFNPRPKIVFAAPLPLGAESNCELLTFQLTEPRDADELAARLAPVLPLGVSLRSVEKDPRDFHEIVYAEYRYRFSEPSFLPDLLPGFMDRDEIKVWKHSKKGEILKDIKPSIGGVRVEDDSLVVLLSVEQDNFIGPEPFTHALEDFLAEQGKEKPHVSLLLRTRMLLRDKTTEY